MAALRFPDLDVANPCVLGGVILDGNEKFQVIVWENGAPTWWALQFPKCRLYVDVLDPNNAFETLASMVQEEPSSKDVSGISAAIPIVTLDADQPKKRIAEDAGPERN